MKRTLHIGSLYGPGVPVPDGTRVRIAPAYTFVDVDKINWAVAQTLRIVSGELTVPNMEDTYEGKPLVWYIQVDFALSSSFESVINDNEFSSFRIFPDNDEPLVEFGDMLPRDPQLTDPSFGPSYIVQTRILRDETKAYRDETHVITAQVPKTLEVVGDDLVVTRGDDSTYIAGDVRGPQGIQGEIGPRGIQGIQGIQGPIGPAGLTWKGMWSSTVDYAKDDAVFYEPSGGSWFASQNPPTGDVPTMSSAYWYPMSNRGIQGIQGPQGVPGTPNVLTIGNVTKLAPGSTPTAGLTGSSPTQVLSLGLVTGDQGTQGPAGPANTLSVGTVTKVEPGGTPTAVVSGTAPNQTLALGLVTGDQGAQGNPGPTGLTGDQFPAISGPTGGTYILGTNGPETRRMGLSSAITIGYATPSSTISFTVTLIFQMGATPYPVTWPTIIRWPEGVKPEVPQVANSRHIFNFLWDGSQWVGVVVGLNLAVAS